MFISNFMQIITCVVISISIIFSIHYSYYYIKDNYMSNKTKYLVNDTQIDKYNKIMDELKQIRIGKDVVTEGGSSLNDNNNDANLASGTTSSSPTSPFKDEKEKSEMNDELTQFINNQFIMPVPSLPPPDLTPIMPASNSSSTTQFTI